MQASGAVRRFADSVEGEESVEFSAMWGPAGFAVRPGAAVAIGAVASSRREDSPKKSDALDHNIELAKLVGTVFEGAGAAPGFRPASVFDSVIDVASRYRAWPKSAQSARGGTDLSLSLSTRLDRDDGDQKRSETQRKPNRASFREREGLSSV